MGLPYKRRQNPLPSPTVLYKGTTQCYKAPALCGVLGKGRTTWVYCVQSYLAFLQDVVFTTQTCELGERRGRDREEKKLTGKEKGVGLPWNLTRVELHCC